jgi:hypothetical protein
MSTLLFPASDLLIFTEDKQVRLLRTSYAIRKSASLASTTGGSQVHQGRSDLFAKTNNKVSVPYYTLQL